MGISISVIIPSYNREKTIIRCINSILNQTKKVFEIIVVDDGSTDRTIERINSIKYESLKILKQNHKGAQAARNLGILNAKGDYIAFLDSDDEWQNDCVETYMRCLSRGNENKVLWTDCYVLNEETNEKKLWSLPGKSGNVYRYLLYQAGPMFQGMLVPRVALIRAGLLDEKVVAFQEWDTAIALSRSTEFVHIKRPMFIYHQHEGETISKSKKAGICGYNYIVAKYKEEIVRNNGYRCLRKHYKGLLADCKCSNNFDMIRLRFKYFFLIIYTLVKELNFKEVR